MITLHKILFITFYIGLTNVSMDIKNALNSFFGEENSKSSDKSISIILLCVQYVDFLMYLDYHKE